MIKYKTASADSDFLNFSFSSINSPSCIMTLRSAGGMGRNTEEDNQERKIFLEKNGIKKHFKLNQIHSRNVFNADELTAEKTADGDGLFSLNPNNVLAVTIADCMPVFFYSRISGAFGVLHSGWKGTGISLEAINKIEQLTGSGSNDFEFILGPCIGSCCYEVDSKRAAEFRNMYGNDSVVKREPASDDIYNHSGNYIDLRTANVNILENQGVKNITVIENCTCCSENFYSFRGDGAKDFQLMLALIGYFR